MVPHLITALKGPINELEQRILDSLPAIERWFRLEWMEHTPPFYASVDVRNAGFKLAPVDTDLFPGAWQNLTPQMQPLAVQAAMAAIEKICPEAKNLLLVPDNILSSATSLSNLANLQQLFHRAGLHVRIGSVSASIEAPTTFELPSGETLLVEPVIRGKHRLGLKNFDPCTILLNNDLRAGAPGILEDLHEQYLLPPLHAGWGMRKKSAHYKAYEEVSKRFAKLLGVDPWLINPLYETCGTVDFSSKAGVDGLRGHVDSLLGKVRRKYKEYGINERPFVVIKADTSTYGLGIITVRDVRDLEAALAKHPGLSPKLKPGQERAQIIVQEGVQTCERINDAVAEPVVYMMDRYVVGGFYRVHADRGFDENLKAPGAAHVPLAFDDGAHMPKVGEKPGASAPNRFYMYGVIGRLALVAAAYELESTDPEAEVYD